MASPETILQRFRVPIGSLVVDIGLVLTLVFTVGQMTERFSTMDQRVTRVEAVNADAKLVALEMRMQATERYQAELKTDIVKRLERIEVLISDRNH